MSDLKVPVIARVCRTRNMVRMVAKQYMIDNKDRIQRVTDRGPITIQMDDKEVVFMTIGEYERWCRGRTYIVKGRLFHSGLPAVRRQRSGEENTERHRDEADV